MPHASNPANLLFQVPPTPTVPVKGSSHLFPVHRVFCVGRNYVEHAKEMGAEVDREAPFYFLKPASALVVASAAGASIPYPPGTENCHYEMEFVVAIGAPAFRIASAEASGIVYGYAGGLDMTRRDLQLAAREKGRPWDLGKAFEHSAIITPITPAAEFGAVAHQAITLKQNGVIKQQSNLAELVWPVAELISHLSRYYHLVPGDLLYTGTPAGVGPVRPGDNLLGEITGLDALRLTIGQPE